jgi:hypothetical protein
VDNDDGGPSAAPKHRACPTPMLKVKVLISSEAVCHGFSAPFLLLSCKTGFRDRMANTGFWAFGAR